MRVLIVGNGNVTRAFRALLDALGERPDISVCDSRDGEPGERVIAAHHSCFDAVLNLSSAPTGPLIDLCARHGLNYLDASFEWRGDGPYSVEDYAAELRDDLRPRDGIATLHGFGMNPGLVEIAAALHAPDRPYLALEVDTDTAEPAKAGAPSVWGTWCPLSYYEETYLVPGAFSTQEKFLAPLPDSLHFGRRLTVGGRPFDFSATIHDETAYLVAHDPNCRGAVFLYAPPPAMAGNLAALREAASRPSEPIPVLHDLKGEECVGIAFYTGPGRGIRYVMNRADHAAAFRAIGCNATCWQVACGVYAGLRLLEKAAPGESLTVSAAMRNPGHRAVLMDAINRAGFRLETIEDFLDAEEVRERILPIFGKMKLSP